MKFAKFLKNTLGSCFCLVSDFNCFLLVCFFSSVKCVNKIEDLQKDGYSFYSTTAIVSIKYYTIHNPRGVFRILSSIKMEEFMILQNTQSKMLDRVLNTPLTYIPYSCSTFCNKIINFYQVLAKPLKF